MRKRPWPSYNRIIATALVIVQALAITLLMHPVIWPVSIVALIGMFAPRLRLLFPIPASVGFITVLLYCALRYQSHDEDFLSMGFIGSRLAYEVACACVGCQLLMLFMQKYADRIPIWYLAFSGTGMVFSGDIRVNFQNGVVFLWVVMAYMACWAGYMLSQRKFTVQPKKGLLVRHVLLLSVVCIAVIAGRLLSQTYQRYANRLEFWVSEYLYQGRISHLGNGFSGKGGLNDISELKWAGGDDVALRVKADFSPDYLRGRVFTEFYQRRWEPSEPLDVKTPLDNRPPIRSYYPEESVYQLTPEWPVSPKTMTVWPFDTQSLAHFFLPLGAGALGCDGGSIKLDRYGIVERDTKPMLDSYVVLVGDQPTLPSDQVDPIFLTLPESLSPVVGQTAAVIFEGKETSLEKMRAVETFFHNHFTYKLGVRIPGGVDRLGYFLTVRPPAHCEYFATATAILLREAGVPARYVTGYVVTGKNSLDQTYYARKRDAHAWVEAYDDVSQRWVVVESTPMEGVPTPEDQQTWTAISSASWGAMIEVTELMRSGVFWVALEKYGKIVVFLVPVLLLLGVGAHFAISRFMAQRKWVARLNSAYLPLTRERARMDRFLSARGVHRPADESLSRFASRLESNTRLSTSAELAEWYRHYAAIRYQDRPFDETSVESIRTARQRLAKLTKVKK